MRHTWRERTSLMPDAVIPDIDTIVSIAENAGKIIQHGTFPVAEADRVSHCALQSDLAKLGIPVISEEGAEKFARSESELLWLVDPLDGTSDFMEGFGEWSVMIALLRRRIPVMGVIAIPSHGKVYAAERGMGVFVFEGGKKRRVEMAARPLAGAPRLLVSRSHYSPLMKEVAAELHANEITMSSIGYKAAAILEGRGDLQLTDGNLGEWDVAAAQCILEEAGGAVSDLSGDPLTYRNPDWRIGEGFVAGTRETVDTAIAVIQKLH